MLSLLKGSATWAHRLSYSVISNILSQRADGLGERLCSLLNAHVLAELLGVPARFTWNSDVWNKDYKETSTSGEISVHNVAMLAHSDLFDPSYIDACYTPNYHRASYRHLHGTNLTLRDLARGGEESEITGWHPTQHDLREHLTSSLARELPELYVRAFQRIGFSERARMIQSLANRDSLPEKLAGIHLRSGDMLFGECRKWGLWSNKVINIPVAKALVERFQREGYSVLISSQDTAVGNYLANRYNVILVDTLNTDAGMNTAERAFHDMMVLSRAQVIVGGRSGFSRFPALIKGSQAREAFSIFPRRTYASITEKDLLANGGCYHPLHESFALWQAYSFYPEGRSASESSRMLRRAAELDPDNMLYPLTIIHVALSRPDYSQAEELLSQLLGRFDAPLGQDHPVIRALLHKYPGLDFSRRKQFDGFKRAAESGQPHFRLVYDLISQRL
jgi:hypothetical protein